jgi:hypothetical protein
MTEVDVRTCPRCHGRMFLNRDTGDQSCFTCGNVVYAQPPIDLETETKRTRHPWHGGVPLN